MSKKRSKESYKALISDFTDKVLVECPNCKRQAQLVVVPSKVYTWTTAMAGSCSHCGFSKIYETLNLPLPVWLKISCEGHTLAALNYEHLAVIKSHVQAFLRERNNVPNRNQSIGSRLPRWMTEAGKRQKVLKCIEKLEKSMDFRP